MDFKDDSKHIGNDFLWTAEPIFYSVEHDKRHVVHFEQEYVPYRKHLYEVVCEQEISLIVISDVELTEKSAEIILREELGGYHVVALLPLEGIEDIEEDSVIYITNGN